MIVLFPLLWNLRGLFSPGWLVDRFPKRPDWQDASIQRFNTLSSDGDVLGLLIASRNPPAVSNGSHKSGPHAGIRIEHSIIFTGQGQHTAFHELNGELARMNRFLGMV